MSGTLHLEDLDTVAITWRAALPTIVARVTTTFDTFSTTAWGNRHMYNLPSGMQIVVAVAYEDANGNPAKIDGEVAWTTSDAAIATAAVDPSDSSKCTVAAVGPVGSAQVTAVADADLGSGVRTLTTLLDISVVAGEAVAGVISVTSDPEPIP